MTELREGMDRLAARTRPPVIRVLIVDDNEIVLRLLADMLKSQSDVEVVGLARDGAEGVERAGDLRPDVVIMDIEMPKMNGLEATRRIKHLVPSVGVLILSGSPGYRKKSLEVGADHCLGKPVDREDLFSTVRDIADSMAKAKLDNPIDVMMLMHKAFRSLSMWVEKLAAEVEEGGDVQEFREEFDLWGKQLLYHATVEDKYMTAPLTDWQPARDNEAEHVALARQAGELIAFMKKGDAAGLEENVKAAMLALEEEQHNEVVNKLQAVESVLKNEIGQGRVIARTRRHLYSRVVALRVAEFDHFENEEAFVVSVVRERMSEAQQLQVARHLLVDEESENPRWIIDWLEDELTPTERRLLSDLERRFETVATT